MRSAHSRKRRSPVMVASRTSTCRTSPFSSAPVSGSAPKSLFTGACSITAAVMSAIR